MSTFQAAHTPRGPHGECRTSKSSESREASHDESDAKAVQAPFRLQLDAHSQERVLDVRKVKDTLA